MTIKTNKFEYYGEINTLHTIELSHLNLGNNFTSEHFKKALQENEEFEDLSEYLSHQDCNDNYIINAQGNYGKVSTGECSVYECNIYLD